MWKGTNHSIFNLNWPSRAWGSQPGFLHSFVRLILTHFEVRPGNRNLKKMTEKIPATYTHITKIEKRYKHYGIKDGRNKRSWCFIYNTPPQKIVNKSYEEWPTQVQHFTLTWYSFNGIERKSWELCNLLGRSLSVSCPFFMYRTRLPKLFFEIFAIYTGKFYPETICNWA